MPNNMDLQKKIDNRIRVKDAREDSKQRAISCAWAIGQAVQTFGIEGVSNGKTEKEIKTLQENRIEAWTDYFLALFDKKFAERTPQDTDESMTEKKRKDVAKETVATSAEELI